MKLNRALQYQTKLEKLMDKADTVLSSDQALLRVETTYCHRQVTPEVEDRVVVEPQSPYAGRLEEMSDFFVYLLDQYDILCHAIQKAQEGIGLDLRLERELNVRRFIAASTFRAMADLRPSETLKPGGWFEFRTNAQGNQVTSQCDVKQVSTPNFDRDKALPLADQLYRSYEEMAVKLELAPIATSVNYQSPFGLHDSFDRIFEQFCAGLLQS